MCMISTKKDSLCGADVLCLKNQNRFHGDLRFIPSGAANDYTTVPDAIARDCKLSLKTKGLYAVLSYLFKIPNFHFSWNSLISLVKRRLKH